MGGISGMTGNVTFSGVRMPKTITVAEFKSWIVSTIGGASHEYLYSVAATNDGGYVAVGSQESEGQGWADALIVKYDSNLNVTAQKGLGGSSNDSYRAVIATSDGGYVAVGHQGSEGQGSYDALIVKYDSNLSVTKQSGIGGSESELFESVIQADDGGFLAVGYQRSQSQGSNESEDLYVVKFDSNLTLIKQVGIGGIQIDTLSTVIQTSDGGYIVVGTQNSGSTTGCIVKLDSNLNVVKQSALDGSKYFNSIIPTSDGGYVVAGVQESQGQGGNDALVVKYDANLNVIKQVGIGGSSSDYLHSIAQAHDGGYVAVGGHGGSDSYIVKLDNNMNVSKQVGINGATSDYLTSVMQSSDGGYVVTGRLFAPSQGGFDGLVAKIPSNFDLMTGSLQNHSGMAWSVPTLVTYEPTLTGSDLTLVVYEPTLTAYQTSLTETSPTLVEARSEKQ